MKKHELRRLAVLAFIRMAGKQGVSDADAADAMGWQDYRFIRMSLAKSGLIVPKKTKRVGGFDKNLWIAKEYTNGR